MAFAIRVDNLSKRYRLGATHAGTVRELIDRAWRTIAGRRPSRMPHEEGQIRDLAGRTLEDDGSFWALRDVCFEVQPGDVIGIIGKNGSGKSTLLKILSQITAPTEGRIEIRGRVASLLEVGTGFHPELSGRENVFLNGAILGMTKLEIRRKFNEIVEFAGIERFIDTPVKRYSSGMYVRLAFAVAAHLEPEVLIVDEVLAVGDASFQARCLGKIREVARGGRTVLLVSHQLASVLALCPNCLWLDKGQIKRAGISSEVISAYTNADGRLEESGEVVLADKPAQAFQLRRVRTCDPTGVAASKFECDVPVCIELALEVRSRVPGLYGYLEIAREDGTTVLVSDSFDGQANSLDNLPVGTHAVRLMIPARSLGPGSYTLYFNFASSLGDRFNIDSPGRVCKFVLADSTSRRGNSRGGFFSTLVPWQTSAVQA